MTHRDNRNATGDADAGHGADNKGNESMKAEDLGAADFQKMSDAELSGIVTSGKSKMEPDKTINLGQVKYIVAFACSPKQ
jgi:hypothetical protein